MYREDRTLETRIYTSGASSALGELKLEYSQAMLPLCYNGDSMRTWRNLGGRANLALLLASLATMIASSENPLDPSRNSWRGPITLRSMTRAVIFLEVSATPINRAVAAAVGQSDFRERR
ncbi:hypothetical protein TNCV_1741351 [Trichonephila clavipes]|uniref:Uncharacterized protein n=1 Tax=Trichonephila clavipes TaxID=2585209 RepID=A0A8X6RDT8_TRICX|nr:hypothetical protein TNCV_1741351 [Trichonephila clavipes]